MYTGHTRTCRCGAGHYRDRVLTGQGSHGTGFSRDRDLTGQGSHWTGTGARFLGEQTGFIRGRTFSRDRDRFRWEWDLTGQGSHETMTGLSWDRVGQIIPGETSHGTMSHLQGFD
jgi:hypothetical protein